MVYEKEAYFKGNKPFYIFLEKHVDD